MSNPIDLTQSYEVVSYLYNKAHEIASTKNITPDNPNYGDVISTLMQMLAKFSPDH